jgi:ubiquinone/menaquinone biosynthesis C-methylase UbiE
VAVIWIGYSTLYGDGGFKFERAAHTLARELAALSPTLEVRCEAVDSKRAFVSAMERIDREGARLSQLHLIGHSELYGPMFRTTAMPEQFSPHEWRSLKIPFADGAQAYFHASRTARWFAPFFARTFGVRAHGYHLYASVSTRRDQFAREGLVSAPDRPLYIVACPGKRSHGVLGSALKYAGLAKAERMTGFDPTPPEGDTSYDAVAELYDRAFTDIGVRADELRWLESRLPGGAVRVLDVGCGNGALLRKLATRIRSGVGVDSSRKMVELARAHSVLQPNLSFVDIQSPKLPFPDASFDLVISLLSFRYLDWDPMMNELRRVVAPGGRILIIDMVAAPTRMREWPLLLRHKARQLVRHQRHATFAHALKRLVRDSRWQTMLKYNPIRSEHEFRRYLESRFPGRSPELLTVGYETRVLAFDSGPL